MNARKRIAAALTIGVVLSTPIALTAASSADASPVTAAAKKPVKKAPAKKKPVKKPVTYRWYDLADYSPSSQTDGIRRAGSAWLGGETGVSAILNFNDFYGRASSAVWKVNGNCTALRGFAGANDEGDGSSQVKLQIMADSRRAYTRVFGGLDGEDVTTSIKGAKNLTIGMYRLQPSGFDVGIIRAQVYCSKAPGPYNQVS